MDTIETKVLHIEQKFMEAKRRNQEQELGLKYAIFAIDDLENRNCWNNIRIRGLPEATVPEELDLK